MKSTSVLKTGERDMSASGTHNPPEFKHAEDMEWEMGRFGNLTKFLFDPRPERPTEPNAGFLKYPPGASFPLHRHDFAQVWYIIEGEFTFARKLYGPGTIAYMPDPHFEYEMHTVTGGTRPADLCRGDAVHHPGGHRAPPRRRAGLLSELRRLGPRRELPDRPELTSAIRSRKRQLDDTHRHGRACPGHPRIAAEPCGLPWMSGSSSGHDGLAFAPTI